MKMRLLVLLIGLVLTSSTSQAINAQGAATPPPELSRAALANGTYETEGAGTVPLVNGAYRGELSAGAVRFFTSARLEESIGYGQWHGIPAAAVVLASNGGGSGTFYELLLILALSGEAVPAGRASLGDRVIINSVSMTPDGTIVVDMMDHGPGEG
jgi:hypothetical protein